MKPQVKYLLLTLFISTLIQTSYAQMIKKYEVNFKDPKSVVGAIFYAAKSKEYKIMATLPDPLGECDGDVKELCSVAELAKQSAGGSENAKKTVDEFVKTFESGQITGEVTYEKEGETEFARVPLSFNSLMGEQRIQETMSLVKRNGNWYLYSM